MINAPHPLAGPNVLALCFDMAPVESDPIMGNSQASNPGVSIPPVSNPVVAVEENVGVTSAAVLGPNRFLCREPRCGVLLPSRKSRYNHYRSIHTALGKVGLNVAVLSA